MRMTYQLPQGLPKSAYSLDSAATCIHTLKINKYGTVLVCEQFCWLQHIFENDQEEQVKKILAF